MISIIIPTLNEERALQRTLEAALVQMGDFEIIVVDGGSSDRTRGIVEDAAARDPRIRLLISECGRARQMNAGAAIAAGEWLLFLHADTHLPEGALERIAGLPKTTCAGCFRHRFSGAGRMLSVLSWFHNRRFRVTRVIYGDQALFVRKPLFEELGRFPLRQMEDIAFGVRLRDATRPVMLPETVTTDSRKFDQMGHWRALVHSVSLLIRFRFGADVSGDEFFTDYR